MIRKQTYVIIDERIKPDALGQLGGVRVDRRTGKVLVGWPHVQQSLGVIFSTRYHERVLRRYVGSFVPHLLGESALPRIITRFFWAIASAIDLWEPCYSIQRVLVGPEVS